MGENLILKKPKRDVVTGRIIHELIPLNKEKVSSFELDEYFNCFEE